MVSLPSCSEWLDVTPNTDLPAKELFTTENVEVHMVYALTAVLTDVGDYAVTSVETFSIGGVDEFTFTGPACSTGEDGGDIDVFCGGGIRIETHLLDCREAVERPEVRNLSDAALFEFLL